MIFWLKGHKILLTLIIVIIGILLITFGTKIYLFLNFILGNDVLMKLEVNKQDITLLNNGEEQVEFEVKVTTNPFCKAVCNSVFEDISTNTIIETSNFNLRPGIPLKKEYTLSSPEFGEGLKLYRMSMECQSIPSLFCHTKDFPSTRKILVTLKYDLNEEEKRLKSSLKSKLENILKNSKLQKQQQEFSNQAFLELSKHITKISFTPYNIINISPLMELWKKQDFISLKSELTKTKINNNVEKQYIFFSESIKNYNKFIYLLDKTNRNLKSLKNKEFVNKTTVNTINKIIDDYNTLIFVFSRKTSLKQKEDLVKNMHNQTKDILKQTEIEFNNTIKKQLQLINHNYELICNATNNCTTTTNYNCDVVEHQNNWIDIFNLTNIIKTNCIILNTSLNDITTTNFKNITINLSITNIEIILEEPTPKCCHQGKCESCCQDCIDKNYPIVFLHGHAFNKDLSAEYSLEGFNMLEQKLEQEKGYLNAGTVTLFTTLDSPQGIWGLPNTPLTIRASYYFDIFKNPENYVAVQAQSESIDTYALRLKELIDTIKFKTGKNKIKIIAYSMGGLVARKYIQVFGSNSVDKLILIGSPNHGIVGDVAEYCPLTGDNLECRDMNSNSLFINKLNNAPTPNIPIYNIIGTGCSSSLGTGDGIVLKEDAWLDGAINFVVNGTCKSNTYPLHVDLGNIIEYPEVFDFINESV